VVVDTIHGVTFEDPFRWLENQDSPETREWIAAQNAYAQAIVNDTTLRAHLAVRLRELMDVEAIGSPRGGGDFEYFTMRRKGEELAAVYRRPAPPEGESLEVDASNVYDIVLDPRDLDVDLRKRFAIRDISDDDRYMIYSIRDGGADEVEMRIRDLENEADLPESYPSALYDAAFFSGDRSDAFYYVRRSRQTGPRLYLHTIGADPAEDEEIWGDAYGPTNFIGARLIDDGRSMLLTGQHGWAKNEVWMMDMQNGDVRPIAVGIDAHIQVRPTDGELFFITDLDAPNYRVVAVDPESPEVENWREVIAEADDVLQNYTRIEDRYYVTYLHDVSTRIIVYDLDGQRIGEVGVPEHHSASIRNASDHDGKVFLTVRGLTTPETEYLVDLKTGEREISEEPKVEFASADYSVRQIWYESNDGTRVPMRIVHRVDIELTGDHPTLLYGYGGFTSSLAPGFSATAATWLEQGGVYAVANIRGGNEFGERWHRGGMLENKQNVFDDFIAAAEWLIDNQYTNPDRLAIRGGSNGGLLVGAALTQRPDLFRAVLCGFPDLDMIRFYTFTETNNMPALLEYGDASKPEQFEFLRRYSPYQAAARRAHYPAVMLTTGDLDTRVPPLQARKMTAQLQASTRSGLPVILRYDPKAGHAAGRGRPLSLAVEDTAMELAFVMMQLGMAGKP
jgi:prolyl oligopeptidase